MRWIKQLENYNISFHIHILQKQDSIFINKKAQNSNIIYILNGFIKLLQVFTNNEKICIELIYKNQIISSDIFNNTNQHSYYYLLVAITTTTIVTIPLKEFNKKAKRDAKIFQLLKLQSKKNDMISILSHKNTKKRIIQLIIILIRKFGCMKKNNIVIPFRPTHQMIAAIVGSQRVTVNKIMKNLKREGMINYSNNSITIYRIIRLIYDKK